MAEIDDLDVNDASNTARFPENMAPSDVNDNLRALEGLLARGFKDIIDGAITTAGTSTAYTVAANRTLTAYYDGLTMCVDFHTTCGAAPTMNIDSIGAKDLYWSDGVPVGSGEIAAGERHFIQYDGTNLLIMDRAPIGVGENTLAPHENLVIDSASSATTVGVTADQLMLRKSNRSGKTVSSVNVTIDITASGANGLDTGAEAAATWYHLWVIYNPSSGTVAGLMSTSTTIGSITLPSGYTYAGYVGAIYNSAGSDLMSMYQVGSDAYSGYNSGNIVSGGTATSYTALDLSGLVPTTAKQLLLEIQIDRSSGTGDVVCIVAPDGSGTTDTHGRPASVQLVSDTVNRGVGSLKCPILTTQQVKYRVIGTNGRTDMTRTGWSFA